MGEATASKKTKRFKWSRRIAIFLAVYTVVGFFVVPYIIKSQMLKQLPPLTKRQAFVEQVKVNPYTFSLTIRGFALKETNGEVFSSFDEFYINFQPWASLFKLSWVFDEISLKKPFAQVTYQPDGTFNFMNLLTNSAPAPKPVKPAAPQALPAALIYHLEITNGEVAFADLNRKVPFHTQFVPIDINLTNLTTVRDHKGPYSILARTDSGEMFGWSGTVTVNPLRSDGTFRLGGLQLPKYATYSHDYARFDITHGLLDIYADYRYDSDVNPLDLSISNAAVQLSNLEIKTPDNGEIVVEIPKFSITDVSANVLNRTARVGLIKSSGGWIVARQNHDGTINLLSPLDLPAKSTADADAKPATTNAEAAPFNAKIDEISIEGYGIKAEDWKPAKPAIFNIKELNVDLKNIYSLSNAPVPVDVSLKIQDTGNIAVNGWVTLLRPSADVAVGITNLDLRCIQPYVEQQIKLAVTSGNLNVHGWAYYNVPEGPLLQFTGGVSVNNFDTADDVLYKDFLKWDALDIDGINFQMQPDRISVDQVKFTGLNTSLIVGPDHRANLQTILRDQIAVKTNSPAATNATASVPVKASNNIPDISLGALVLDNASIHFADESVEPHCSFDVQQFGGSIKGLTSKPDTTAVIDVNGKVDTRSPFSVSGKIHPLGGDLFADVTVAFTNTELTAFTPYTEKFAGRPLQKGKLSFAVHYNIQKNVLKAENYFFVDQMTLGPKNDSTNATHLPVKLAIALLKDRNGRIELNVPVQGHTDDPKFAVGPIIWHVVYNLMEKAALSPFSLLGSMFGSSEQLNFVSFAPGEAIIPDTETNKLDTLIKALYNRPELTMEINGSADPEQDRMPIAHAKLDAQLKSLWIKEQTDDGKPAMSLADVHLEQPQYEKLLKKQYRAIFGKYKPEDPSTNTQANGTSTNGVKTDAASQRAVVASAPLPHGAQSLMGDFIHHFKPSTKPSAKKARPVKAVASTDKPVELQTPAEPVLADMEERLLQKQEITQDDLRDLMKRRAEAVQTYLSKGGQISGDRLFITAPKPMNAQSKGADRVDLTLD